MKDFLSYTLSIPKCKAELKEFKRLLESKAELKEKNDILPFFKKRCNLSAFLGTYVTQLGIPDRIATEYDIFGDFACDLVLGNSISKTFLLVEFEDAKKESLFVKKRNKATSEWSSRLEHGYSQVVDWFWKLDDMEKTGDYINRFGAQCADIHGLVVVGRDQTLSQNEKDRLNWRQNHTVVHSKRISIITFDQLVRDIEFRLSTYPEAAKVENFPSKNKIEELTG